MSAHLRTSLATLVAVGAVLAAGAAPAAESRPGPFSLAPLPYERGALEPVISARTLSFHYDKHHRGYVARTNELVAGTPMAAMTLEQVVRVAAADPARRTLFTTAAQVGTHDFYWRSLKPGGSKPSAALLERINRDFGSLDALKQKLVEAAVNKFASGYAWLVLDGDKLAVVTSDDAQTPMVGGQRPLLAVDVWEHAYYLDYQHERRKHVEQVVGTLLNWEFASKNLEAK